MIKIYTYYKYFKRNEIVIDNEEFFKNIRIEDLSSECLDIMRKIDKAELLDIQTGKIKTPYGVCNIGNLSTGCKTAINVLYIHNSNKFQEIKAVNITDCGINAIEEIFNMVEKHEINLGLVLKHEDNIFKCEERDFIVNDKHRINQLVFIGSCF